MLKIEINDFLPKLRGVKKNGSGWQALCPAHNDKKPSLSVIQTNGYALFHCHAGCEFVQIVQALGLSEREQNEQKKKKRIVDTYDYVDENGELLYQAVRFEPKDFKLRKPDGLGGWVWSAEGTRRVLYRLPELLQAREDDFYVIFCEGEKDADNVRGKLNLPATSIAQGAKAWKDEYKYADLLFGFNVVILPDNDSTGKAFAKQVANSIYDKAQSVRVIELPNLPEKADVSDWIDNGGTRESLIDLIDKTPEWEVTSNITQSDDKNKNLFIIKSANEWIGEAKSKPIPKMLFGELWFEDELCILFADSNVGKSILAVQIADSITKGKAIAPLSLEVEPQKVLYCDFELGDRQFANRYSEKGDGILNNEYQFSNDFLRVAINPDADYLDGTTFEECLVNQIETTISETDIKIIIIDNLSYVQSDNERAKDALPLMQKLKELKLKYNLSVLILAHTPKRDLSRAITQNDLQGSKAIMNFCDTSFTIGKSNEGENIRYLKQIKERNTGKIYGSENVCIAEVQKSSNFLSLNFIGFGDEQQHLKVKTENEKEAKYQQVVDLISQGNTYDKIASIVGIAKGSVKTYLDRAESLGIKPSSDVQSVQSVQPLFDLNKMNVEEPEKELDIPF